MLPLIHRDPVSGIAEFEQILASNSGEDPFDAAIKLLAAKLFAETESRVAEFQLQKTPEATHRAIQLLYRSALRKWPLLNGIGSDLSISPQHLVRSLRPLMGWQLLDSDLTILDATLERLVARDAKGALGQYFTPRDVVRFCIEVLNPGPKDKVIDPACGSGGFLFEATNHALRNGVSPPACLGIDFGARAIKVAALLTAATRKAKIALSKANSIDGRAYAQHAPSEWSAFLSRAAGAPTGRAIAWGAWNRLGCTVVATNPPFAGDIDEPDLLDAYESQRLAGRKVSREHLFLERAVHLLRPGGRLAIVLPQGLLANPSASYLRAWLFRKCRVLGVIGLHAHAFLPHTSVKTALLFAVKLHGDEVPPKDYPIFFATSRSCGKDSRGKPTGTSDYARIAASFSAFLSTQRFPWTTSLGAMGSLRAKVEAETVAYPEVFKSDRLDAEYYDSEARALLRGLDARPAEQLSSLVESKPERYKRSAFRSIRYLDISSVDSKTGLTTPSTISVDDVPSRASYIVQPGDVLVSTVRPDRNVIALVTDKGEVPTVASNGFCVLRPRSVAPEVLFAYCKTESFRRMLSRHATASMYPTVTDRDVLSIPFLAPPKQVCDRVSTLVKSSLEMLEKAKAQLNDAIGLMNEHIPYAKSERRGDEEIRLEQSRSTYRSKKRKR